MQYTFVDSQQALDAFCLQALKASAIAVDTEFVRTRTLYPQLGLIQIYDGHTLALIDPLVINDFSQLIALLTAANVIKVLHSCSEDLETFWHAFNVVPSPVFDSQFAASITGMGTSLGYAKLVENMLGTVLDKGESRTDWLARPLSSQQLEYAANDVLYLFELFPALQREVEQQGKGQWVYQEMAMLATKKCHAASPEYAYLGFKNNWKLAATSLYALKQLGAWRLDTARKKDLAVNFVIKEQILWNIARYLPSNQQALMNIQGIGRHELRLYADVLLDIVAQAQLIDSEDCPPRIERLTDFSGYKTILADIKAICQDVAEAQQVPIELVGSKKQLNQLIKWCWFSLDETRLAGQTPDLLVGWRKALFLDKLLALPGLNLSSGWKES